MKLTATNVLAFGVVAIGAGLAIAAVVGGRDALRAAGRAVDPTSSDNLVSRGVNQFVDVLDDADDNDSFSLGSFLFDVGQRVRGIPPYDPNRQPLGTIGGGGGF